MTEADMHPGFIERPMMEQLGKIVDSETLREVVPAHKFKPVNKVLTDDGKSYTINAQQAERVMNFVADVRMPYRRDIMYGMQNSKGFETLMKWVFK